MSEPTIAELAATIRRLSDDSAQRLHVELMERLTPVYRLGGGSLADPEVGYSPFDVATVIPDGAITDGSFASTIAPVLLRTTATLTNADAIANPFRVAFNTTNSKLYRSDGATWTAAVPAVDLTGQITSTQITDGSITTPKMTANTIDGSVITAGTMAANKLVADSITAGQMAVGAIGVSELAAGAVTAGSIAVGVIDPTMMSGDSTNLVPNPGGEAATVSGQTTLQGWTLGTGWTMRTGSLMRSGNAVFQYTAPGGTDTPLINTGFLPIQGDRRYRASVWTGGWASNVGVMPSSFFVAWYDQSKTIISNSAGISSSVGTSSAFSEKAQTVTAPVSAVWARVILQIATGHNAGDRMYADDFGLYLADQDVSHAGGDVIIDSSGVTITNGALTVSNSGSTVIIDGTSNMFKIAATGTQSATLSTTPGIVTVGTAITALGVLATIPAALCYVAAGTGTGNSRWLSYWPVYPEAGRYVASTSGGVVTNRIQASFASVFGFAKLDASSYVNVYLQYQDETTGGSITMYERYYVLQETSI